MNTVAKPQALHRYMIPVLACIDATSPYEARELLDNDTSDYNGANDEGHRLWICRDSNATDLGLADDLDDGDPSTLKHFPMPQVQDRIQELTTMVRDLADMARDLVDLHDPRSSLCESHRKLVVAQARGMLSACARPHTDQQRHVTLPCGLPNDLPTPRNTVASTVR